MPVPLIEEAKKSGTPVVLVSEKSSVAITAVHTVLDEHLAPRARLHGVLIDIFEVTVNRKTAFVGGNHEFLSEHGRLIDARTLFHYMATGVTPAMVAAVPGKGSQYALAKAIQRARHRQGSKPEMLDCPS